MRDLRRQHGQQLDPMGKLELQLSIQADDLPELLHLPSNNNSIQASIAPRNPNGYDRFMALLVRYSPRGRPPTGAAIVEAGAHSRV